MTNGHGTETPANKFATAQATLELAVRFNAEVNAGRINALIYQREVTVITGGPGLRLPAFPAGTDDDLRSGSYNLVLVALSASALTADETLDEVFGKAPLDTEASRVGIRIMVNQLRNAFAHNHGVHAGWSIPSTGRRIRSPWTTVRCSRLTQRTWTVTDSSPSKSGASNSG